MFTAIARWFTRWKMPRFAPIGKLKLVYSFVVVGLLVCHPAIAPTNFHFKSIAQLSPAQTEKLAEDVRTAAENSFNGLETTKELIGKTKYRKDAIGYGRTKASQKLKALSDKLEASEGQIDRSLTPTEKIVVDQLKSKNPNS